MIYVYFFIKCVVRWSENSVRFENLMGIDFQKAQILLDLSHSERYGVYLILVFYGGYHIIFNTSVINNCFITQQFESFKVKSFVFDNQF